MTIGILHDDHMPTAFRSIQDDQQQAGSFGVRDAFAVAHRRLPLILAITLAGTLLSLAASVGLEKTYTARSMILLKQDDPNLLEVSSQPQTMAPNTPRMDTETDLMTSRVFAGRIVDSLNLIADPGFNTFLPRPPATDAEEPQGFVAAGLSSAVLWVKSALPSFGEEDNAPLPLPSVQRDRAITVLLSKFSISRNGESYAITVTVNDNDPKMAAALADAVTRLYLEWSGEMKLKSTKDSVEFLRQQSRELALRISLLETNIASFGREKGVSSDPRDDLLRATLQQANEQLSVARGELTQAQARLDQIRMGKEASADSIGPLLASDFLTKLRGEEATALNDRAQIARNFGANHPLIQEADAKVASLDAMIAQEVQRIEAGVMNDVRVAQGRVRKLEQDLAVSEGELRKRAESDIRLRELNRDLTTEQQLYDVVSERLGKLDPYAQIVTPNASVLSYAAVPIDPSFPKTYVLVAGGFVGSVFLALFAVVGLETLDTSLRHPKRAAQIARAPALSAIPKLPRPFRKRRYDVLGYMCEYPRSAVAEGFRSIYAACRRMPRSQEGGQVVLVTSSLPGEGKTTTAVGLAVAAAFEGTRTVLIDLDLRTRGLEKAGWVAENHANLEDFLYGRSSLEDVAQPIPGIPGLDVIVSSPLAIHIPKVLGAGSLQSLIARLRSDYDFVVVDSPPLLVVDDAMAIAPHTDGVVVIAAWGGTSEEALEEASRRLAAGDIRPIGVVLNGVDPNAEGAVAFCRTRAHRRQVKRYFSRDF